MAEQNTVASAVEIVVSWNGSPLDTALARGNAPVHVGPSASAWFMVPADVLPQDHALLRPENGSWVLCPPAGASVKVARGGRIVEPAEAIVIDAHTTAEVVLGPLSFFLRGGEPVAAAPRGGAGWTWASWIGAAAALHGVLLAAFALSPPAAGALSVNAGEHEAMRRLSFQLEVPERQPEPVATTPAPAGGAPSAPGGSGGGQSAVPRESSSPGPRRTDGRRQPRPSAQERDVREMGVIAALNAQSFGDERSPFIVGSEERGEGGLATSTSPLSLPDGLSFGPLRMRSTGVGTCDPSRENCVGDAVAVRLETHGPGPSGRHVSLGDRREGRVPGRIREERTETRGALSREQVRRVVQLRLNEVRSCYQDALQRRPDLEGRVTVHFMVDPNGSVSSASVSSTVSDPAVGTCVGAAVQRWRFPQSEGATGVSYPFVMQAQ
jgi:TonB family protein